MIKIFNDLLLGGFKEIPTKFFTFPDGTRHVKIDAGKGGKLEHVLVEAQMNSSSDIMDMLLLVDALRRLIKVQTLILYMPYMLGSRQDRVMVKGEPLSVQVYANIINSMNFDRVVVLDPHSPATVAALNNAAIDNVSNVFYTDIPIGRPDLAVVVSPDAGAEKRASEFTRYGTIRTLIKADKTRDMETGNITDFNLYAEESQIKDKDVYIVDDIVTNGGTFLGLLQEIKKLNPSTVNLVVTHADSLEGLNKMASNFDFVYTTNSKDAYTSFGNIYITDVFEG